MTAACSGDMPKPARISTPARMDSGSCLAALAASMILFAIRKVAASLRSAFCWMSIMPSSKSDACLTARARGIAAIMPPCMFFMPASRALCPWALALACRAMISRWAFSLMFVAEIASSRLFSRSSISRVATPAFPISSRRFFSSVFCDLAVSFSFLRLELAPLEPVMMLRRVPVKASIPLNITVRASRRSLICFPPYWPCSTG